LKKIPVIDSDSDFPTLTRAPLLNNAGKHSSYAESNLPGGYGCCVGLRTPIFLSHGCRALLLSGDFTTIFVANYGGWPGLECETVTLLLNETRPRRMVAPK
jgi:hypothetical protein